MFSIQLNPHESDKMVEMVSNTTRRQQFIKSVVDFCKDYDFDGVDFVWLFPSPIDDDFKSFNKSIFTTFLKDLYKTLRFA